jgi:hypothetical protein
VAVPSPQPVIPVTYALLRKAYTEGSQSSLAWKLSETLFDKKQRKKNVSDIA